jgi:hypothetical protein
MNKIMPSLRKIVFTLVAPLFFCSSAVMGAGSTDWRSREWNQDTVREFVAFSTRAVLKNALGMPDEDRGSTWVYSGVMVTNPEGHKSPQKLVIGFEGTNAESKVSSVSLEAMDK